MSDNDIKIIEELETQMSELQDYKEEISTAARNCFNEAWQLKSLLTNLVVAGY